MAIPDMYELLKQSKWEGLKWFSQFSDKVGIKVTCFIISCHNWRASEASETLSGITNGNRRYIYIY